MTDSALAKKQLVESSFDLAAPVYDRLPFFVPFGEQLVALADVRAGDRVLDIACGTGAVLLPAALRAGAGGHVSGIDLSLQMLEITRQEVVRHGISNVDTSQVDAERLEFADATFDVALCGFALWFIPDLSAALAEVRRVLKPGSSFAATTWCDFGELLLRYRRLTSNYGVGPEALASHSLNTPEALQAVLQQAGFKDIVVEVHEHIAVYHDTEEWWQRDAFRPQALRDIGPEQLAVLKQEAVALALEYAAAEGIRIRRTAVFVRAVSPGGP